MARLRKAKLRAQRIEAGYYLRPHPIRRWRVWLSLLALAASGAWAAALYRTPHPPAASPGPVSAAHELIGARCETCHADGPGLVAAGQTAPHDLRWRGASDAACLTCHAVPVHHASERDAPACADCHVEHRGSATRLDAVRVPRCTGCHADLPSHMQGTPRVVAERGLHITDFDRHPEFAVWTGALGHSRRVALDAAPSDPTALTFSHERHLKPLPGPPPAHPRADAAGNVQLVCGDCHAGAMTPAQWAFAIASSSHAPETPADITPAEEATYMAPIRYAQQCAACHPHNFADDRFADRPAPHDRPEVIRAFLRGLYAQWIVAHPDELAGPPRRRPIGEDRAVARSAETAEMWVEARVEDAERVLFEDPKRCRLCHALQDGADGLPTVAPTRIPVRWLPQSRFDHGRHRLLSCDQCHDARASTASTSVMIPRRAVCANCHRAEGASDACATCHTYHGAVTAAAMDGRLRIGPLAGEP